MNRNNSKTFRSDELKNKKIETYKMVFDLMKQLTTLSSGSILLLITLLEKVFHTSALISELRMALIGFFSSIITAVIAMLIIGMNASDGKLSETERNVFATSTVFSALAFFVGMVATVFALVPG
ncbi:MAG: hypothetical protein ACXWIN_10885, partial [Burkholderiaceae bacterium]